MNRGRGPHAADELSATSVGTRRSVVIERVDPEIDGGRHPVKRVVGDWFTVSADIFADGHDRLAAALLLRADDEADWREVRMQPVGHDRWSVTVRLRRNRWHVYTLEAWVDEVASWSDRLSRKVAGGLDPRIELAEARRLLPQVAGRATASGASRDAAVLRAALADLQSASSTAAAARVASRTSLLAAGSRHPDRSAASRYDRELEVVVDRRAAVSGAWYEFFPRSQGTQPGEATDLRASARRLPEIAGMGFEVVYLPPIHPIGRTRRKGRNNAIAAQPGDVGSPWAVGSEAGGHEAVAPELGGLPAFAHFQRAAKRLGLEVALDLAVQASPDHPWVRQHPDWFRHAPDGTIRHAENPPKLYQDIYPFDFHAPESASRVELWSAWRDLVRLWVARGVRIFRVDNPHTKPVAFWAWLIREIQRDRPDVVFLAEAFTRPKPMRALAKAGFSQSYTYFTWRTTRDGLRELITELTRGEMRQYYRGNLFTNTPDINSRLLDHGRPAFVARAVLASTLSGLWGMYSGFELLERERLPGTEEYRDSEKFEIRTRDWDAPGNIRDLVTTLNRLRRQSPALQRGENLRFEAVDGAHTLFYRHALPMGRVDILAEEPERWREPVWVAVNVDPTRAEAVVLRPDLAAVGIDSRKPYRLIDLVSGSVRERRGRSIRLRLDPARRAFHIFTLSQS